MRPNREAVNGPGFVILAGAQDGAREVWLVRAVGIVLRFKAEPAAMDIGLAALTFQPTVQEISAVELNARLLGEDLHKASGSRLVHGGRQRHQPFHALFFKHEVVVVPQPVLKLLILESDIATYGFGRGEVERGSRHRGNLSDRNQAAVDRCVTLGVEHDSRSAVHCRPSRCR